MKIREIVTEAAGSKKQQQFFGIVRAMQKGDIPKSGEAGKVATDMKKSDVKDFAKTKHKGLPTKKKKKKKTNEAQEIGKWEVIGGVKYYMVTNKSGKTRGFSGPTPAAKKYKETGGKYPWESTNEEAAGVGIVTKQNATADVPVGGEYMNVKKLFPKKQRKSKKK